MASRATLHPSALLSELGRDYRHAQQEHDRESPRGATRRRISKDMERLAERFERTLEHWVTDEAVRHAWREHLYRGAPAPDRPTLAPPPLFRGRTEADALLEIVPADDGGYDLFLDGAHVEHHEIPWHLDPEALEPIQIGQWQCREIFAAPDAAAAALGAFLGTNGASPPWQWARPLFEDGLIDLDFGLTPRGARRLGKTPNADLTTDRAHVSYCVLLANAGRARIFTLASAAPDAESTLAPLAEASDLSNQEARARDSERFSDTRPGLRRESHSGPRHAVSDRREGNRRDSERQFARVVARETADTWSQLDDCRLVVAAAPRMLGHLRPALAQQNHVAPPATSVELARDLTGLAPAAIHDALAAEGLLPERGRRPPPVPMRTPNPWQGS